MSKKQTVEFYIQDDRQCEYLQDILVRLCGFKKVEPPTTDNLNSKKVIRNVKVNKKGNKGSKRPL